MPTLWRTKQQPTHGAWDGLQSEGDGMTNPTNRSGDTTFWNQPPRQERPTATPLLMSMILAADEEIKAGAEGWLEHPDDFADDVAWLIENGLAESNGDHVRPTQRGRDSVTISQVQ